jgi:hypothetical protein
LVDLVWKKGAQDYCDFRCPDVQRKNKRNPIRRWEKVFQKKLPKSKFDVHLIDRTNGSENSSFGVLWRSRPESIISGN